MLLWLFSLNSVSYRSDSRGQYWTRNFNVLFLIFLYIIFLENCNSITKYFFFVQIHWKCPNTGQVWQWRKKKNTTCSTISTRHTQWLFFPPASSRWHHGPWKDGPFLFKLYHLVNVNQYSSTLKYYFPPVSHAIGYWIICNHLKALIIFASICFHN